MNLARHSPRRLIAMLVLVSGSLMAAAGEEVSPEEVRQGYRMRTLLAKPRANRGPLERAEAAAGARLVRLHARLGGLRVLETEGDAREAIKQLAASGLYEYVEPDYIRHAHTVPNDPRFAQDQWALSNTGQDGGTANADISAPAAWDIQREAPDVTVAVLDTGVFTFHEDIIANMWVNKGEAGGRPGVDDDGNGYIDDINGINTTIAMTSARAGDPGDDHGHGSHVAGIIGAMGDNGRGIAGVAWKVKVMALKFMTPRGGTVSSAVAAIDYALAKGANIVNGSYGSLVASEAEFDAIKRLRDAGIIFVASAGNDSQEISEVPEYPAAYPLDNIVAVASTTRQDKLASYSTYGSGLVELAAPGTSILSLGLTDSQTYATLSGTSMAAPHVTGALALLKQKFPGENHRALINRLLSSVDVLPALNNRVHTNGRLNLLRALTGDKTTPFNDDFARRATITGPANVVRSSTQYGTLEPGEPDHGAAGAAASLWWTWTAPEGTGTVTISTAGSAIDTVVSVYSTTAPATLGTLRRVAFNDNTNAETTTSSVTFPATAGTSYAIAVTSKGAEGFITFNLVSVAVNDMFAAARVLTGPSVVLEGNNANATSEPNEPKARNSAGRGIGSGRSLWYQWVAPATRSYQISVDGKSTDPVTAVYTGTALATLAEVAYDDDSGPGMDSLVRINTTAGVTYHICVDSYSGAGFFTLSIADAAWQYVADYGFYATPAMGPDGALYAADVLGYIHAVSPNGTRKWRKFVNGVVSSGGLAVGADGTLYAADSYGYAYALNPADGSFNWRYETTGFIRAAAAVAADGTIYIKSDDDFLHALNPDGTLKWKSPLPGDTYAAPVIAVDGTIYIGSSKDKALYALNADGSVKWRTDLGSTVYGSPALGGDGTIYVGNYDGRFLALRPDGTQRWKFDTGSPLTTSAVLDARGVLYFGSYDRKVYALDAATGVKRWEYATGDIIRSTAGLIADDGAIYVGGDDRLVHVLNPDGTLRRTYATTGAILGAPMMAGGQLYVVSADAKLYAFDTGTNVARSPWPMHRHNVRRVARALEPLPGLPTITTQPAAATATSGTAASFRVAATLAGAGTLGYQWRVNDVPIAGATDATLTFASAQLSNVGNYNVVVTGPGGSIVSQAVPLAVTTGATNNSRLINLAVRTTAGAGDRVLFVGFVVGGDNTTGLKPLLLRGVGPTLGGFGVASALADPKLEIYRAGATTPLLVNDNWAGDTQVSLVGPQVGAFALTPATSRDAAVSTAQTAGGYTMQISSVDPAATGTVLAEIYDATPPSTFGAATPRLINVSARTQVGTGGDILIAGFVVGGTSSKTVLVRAIGPTLTVFGVPGVLADPKLEVYQAGLGAAIASNDNWGAAPNAVQIAAAAVRVGAFPLALESKDAVLLVTLPPGTYTAQISGANNGVGAAIVEVYEVP